MPACSGTANCPVISGTKVFEGYFGGGGGGSFTYLNLFGQKKSSKGIRTIHLGFRKQSGKQKDPQRACVRGLE